MPAGRPTKYKKDYGEKLISHMKQGYSFESFGGIIEVAKDTLQKWEKRYKEFAAARKKGETQCLIWWERIGRAGMLDQPLKTDNGKLIQVKKFNTAIWIFNMKNRFKWRDIEPSEFKPTVDKNTSKRVADEVKAMLEDLKQGSITHHKE